MDVTDKIQAKLQAALSCDHLSLIDESAAHAGHAGAKGGGGHYQLTLVASEFEGKNMMEQHRLVYGALGEMMGQEIHALALKTWSPSQWSASSSAH